MLPAWLCISLAVGKRLADERLAQAPLRRAPHGCRKIAISLIIMRHSAQLKRCSQRGPDVSRSGRHLAAICNVNRVMQDHLWRNQQVTAWALLSSLQIGCVMCNASVAQFMARVRNPGTGLTLDGEALKLFLASRFPTRSASKPSWRRFLPDFHPQVSIQVLFSHHRCSGGIAAGRGCVRCAEQSSHDWPR